MHWEIEATGTEQVARSCWKTIQWASGFDVTTDLERLWLKQGKGTITGLS